MPGEGGATIMKTALPRFLVSLLAVVAVLGPSTSARADESAGEVASKRLGVGYKIGNGLGFVGADVIIVPMDHLSLDLQANYLSVGTDAGTATGYGLAPSVQAHLFKGQVSSPYLGLGYVFASLSLDTITSSTSGFFANVGYDWRWSSGLGILVGAGVAHLGNVHATNGVETLDRPGGTLFNLEVGLRYMFL